MNNKYIWSRTDHKWLRSKGILGYQLTSNICVMTAIVFGCCISTYVTFMHCWFVLETQCKTEIMAVTENRLKLAKRKCNVLQNRWECTFTNLLLEYQLSASQDTLAQYSRGKRNFPETLEFLLPGTWWKHLVYSIMESATVAKFYGQAANRALSQSRLGSFFFYRYYFVESIIFPAARVLQLPPARRISERLSTR